MGVVDGAPSAAWGQALGPTKLLIIPAGEFERLLLTQPAMGLKVCRVLAGKLRATADQLDAAIFLSARERVLRQLVRLAERHGSATPPGATTPPGAVTLGVRLTHQEIARLVGTARETVSRVLAELQDLKLLRFEERRMQIGDLAALRKLAGVDAVDTTVTRA
jgi:CRP/FNR family transcriptional regulator